MGRSYEASSLGTRFWASMYEFPSALALKDLQAAGYIQREVVDDYPPTTLYRLTRAGGRLRAIIV